MVKQVWDMVTRAELAQRIDGVERRRDLVEEIDRTRAREEEREQEREGAESLLAAREQREAGDVLAGRA